MPLTGTVATHPAQYSPEILNVIDAVLAGMRGVTSVHDPFAGLGLRLGALCDRRGWAFTGTDIEEWPGADRRVEPGDSTDWVTYPGDDFVVVTSPVYFGNRISSDYVNGPTPTTKTAGRRAYGISLGRRLDPDNAARVCKPNQLAEYLDLHRRAMAHWGDRAVVNVDAPMGGAFESLLDEAGFEVVEIHHATTRRYIVAGHGDTRAPHEVILEAVRR